MEKANEKVIEDVIYSSSQSIFRRVIYKINETKIKLLVCSDSFKAQCYAKAYALEGFEWKEVYFLPSSLMTTQESLRFENKTTKKDFEKDIKSLKKMIEEILF